MLSRRSPRLLAVAVLVAVSSATLGAGVGAAQPSSPGTTAPGAAAEPSPVEYDPVPPGYDPAGDSMGSTVPGRDDPALSAQAVPAVAAGQPAGLDVASYQGNVNWGAVAAAGNRFAYVKATEGSPGAGAYVNPFYAQQYTGSYNAGLIRGAYHFALPNLSSGAAQAQYFVANGGGWSNDARTLPPMLDIEYNPYGATCFGLSQSRMTSWIREFSDTVRSLTGRYPMIYSTTDWWSQCTGNDGSFGQTNPLFIARYAATPGTLPNGWGFHTLWQYSASGPSLPGSPGVNYDQDVFNGSYAQLVTLARGDGTAGPGTPSAPAPAPPQDIFALLLAAFFAFLAFFGLV